MVPISAWRVSPILKKNGAISGPAAPIVIFSTPTTPPNTKNRRWMSVRSGWVPISNQPGFQVAINTKVPINARVTVGGSACATSIPTKPIGTNIAE